MLNACPPPPQQSEFQGMIADDQPSHAVLYGDVSMQRDLSKLAELQREGYSDGGRERWPVSGHNLHEGSPDASFRSHYSGYDERAMCDGMTWRSQDEVRASLF